MVFSQKDSIKKSIAVDSLNRKAKPITQHLNKIDSLLKYHSPRKAAISSAILPGLGQIYNKKYWKLPLVYGGLGTAAYVFFFNLSTYKELRFAYKAKTEVIPKIPYAISDSVDYKKIKSFLLPLSLNDLRTNRNAFRKNIDYSVLVFILLWGLNVADAAVDAHLKTFDVSPDLTLHLNIGHNKLGGTDGVSLVLALK
ncbi:MAG: DUF5683 domain-containing protein [Flavisolibacter sp.]